MENIHEVGVAAYRAAEETQPPLTGAEQCQAIGSFLYKVVRYLVLATFAWCQVIKEVFVPPPRQSVKGKIALVTGGANGLGRATCLRLAQEGCNIVVVDVDNENIKRTVEDLRGMKVTAMGYRVDITDFEAVKALRKTIISDMGGVVDILINNAGVLPKVSLLEGTEKDIDRIVDVNFRSHFWVSSATVG
jgi:all-trans-retinol dehydrogenase (NAD+)